MALLSFVDSTPRQLREDEQVVRAQISGGLFRPISAPRTQGTDAPHHRPAHFSRSLILPRPIVHIVSSAENAVNIDQRELKLRRALETDEACKADIIIIYDGQCIFCNSYIKLMRLRESAGHVLLLDARQGMVARQVKDTLGLDLDEGMLVLCGDRAYYGADALHVLSSLTSSFDAWNATMAFVFSRSWLARLLYPALKIGRGAALVALGRSRIKV